jgi:hypothetical protein
MNGLLQNCLFFFIDWNQVRSASPLSYKLGSPYLASANIKLKDTPDEADSSYETWIRAQNPQKINKSLNKGPNSGTLKDIDTSVDADLYRDLFDFYPLANEVAKGYSNATVRPSVTSLWTLCNQHPSMDFDQTWYILSKGCYGRTDGGVTISLRNFVGEGIKIE